MKLFNKLYLFIFVALAFACDPYEDTFQELEESAPGPIANIEITLSDDDYALLEGVEGAENIVQYGNFDNEEDVREFIPRILTQKYPLFDNKSLVTVNYDFFIGTAPEVRQYTNVIKYDVMSSDYAEINGDPATYGVFTSSQTPESYIPAILADTLSNEVFENEGEEAPEAGDLALVSYKYAENVNDPSVNISMSDNGYTTLIDYVESEFGSEYIDPNYGSQEYYFGGSNFYDNFEGRIGTRKAWIADKNLNDDLFVGSQDTEEDSIRIEERIQAGIHKYLELSFPNATPVANGVNRYFFVEYDVYYGNETVTWYAKYQVENVAPNLSFFLVEGPTKTELSSSTTSIVKGDYYEFSGSEWELVENDDVYYLTSADYDAMGAPGQYDNFSSSVDPDDYIGKLLNDLFTYAQNEDEKTIIYKYFSDGEVQIYGDHYTYLNGSWDKYNNVIEEQLQFAKEEGVWVPDNTIAYTLSGADYELIGDIAIENGDVARGENLQQYSNFYQNFPGGDTHWTDEQIVAVLDQFLKIKYPDLGPGQKFTITYVAYTGSAVELQMNLIQNEEGNYVINE